MRIRQVKPAFWTDKVMARLSKSARLVYIGLWMLSDDAGWVEWDLEQAGAELFPWESVKRRERDLAADLLALESAGRVVQHPCGCLHVPHLEEHQRISGVRSFRVRDAHAKHLPRTTKQDPLSDSPGRVGNGRVGNGRVGNGRVGNGRVGNVTERNGSADARGSNDPTTETTAFSARVPRPA